MTVEEIKQRLDIIQLASSYGFEFKKPHGTRYRATENLLRAENTSSLDFFTDTQKYYDRGSGQGGDAIDLIQHFEKCDNKEAINKAKTMVGADTYQVTIQKPLKKETTEKKHIDFNKLNYIAGKELSNAQNYKPILFETHFENKQGHLDKIERSISIKDEYKKLFEARQLDEKYNDKIMYLFKTIIGYSEYWKAPSIIIHDRDNRVVDIVTYRPKDKETGLEIDNMKYHYKNFHQRGFRFVYPFENLVNRIAKREKYIMVGEGLKNAINALIYDVPFISIESSSNSKKLDEELIKAINLFLEKGYGLVTAFDGDEAGEIAYNDFLLATGLSAENMWDFKSGIDFVNYVRANDK